MQHTLNLLLEIIRIDFFIAFGIFSLIYLIISVFIKKTILENIDNHAISFISFLGIIFLIIWITSIIISYTENSIDEKNYMLNRMFGKYWFGYWAQPLLWILATQLYRFKKISENILFRIVSSFILIISIEQYIILITSLHSDYLPSSYRMHNNADIYPENLIISLLIKITIYLCFSELYRLICLEINKVRIRNFG